MTELRFFVDEWTGAGTGSREETATSATLRIEVGDVVVTRNENLWSRSVSDRVHLSLYPAALWMASNWWRLCHEAPSLTDFQGYEWRSAHDLAAAGRGYLWPSVTFTSDGESVSVECVPTAQGTRQPIRYLQSTSAVVSLARFERAAEEFIDTVIARMRSEDVVDTDLESLWQQVQAERSDPTESRDRQLEAMMHFDPDEAPAEGIAALERLSEKAGPAATREIAGAIRREDPLQDLRSLEEHVDARHGDLGGAAPASDRALSRICRELIQDRAKLPWQRGMLAARETRTAWSLDGEPIPSASLARLLSLSPSALAAHAWRPGAPIALVVRHRDELQWLVRARHPRARRFEVARLLGDLLSAPTGDAWSPATELRTARQQFQRAFAAELLCPSKRLGEVLAGDRSEDAIVAAADYFDVSEQAVAHQVKNHLGGFSRSSQDPRA